MRVTILILLLTIAISCSYSLPNNQNSDQVESKIKIDGLFEHCRHTAQSMGTSLLQAMGQSISMLQGVFQITASDSKAPPLHNFALRSSGARIIESRGGFINPKTVLNSVKDQYTSFPCKIIANKPPSIEIQLQEDALVDQISLVFLETYTGYVKHFQLLLSLDGKPDTWISSRVLKAVKGQRLQSFKLEKAVIARRVKFQVLSSYYSPSHYCTITQLIVNGKTYLSYTSDKITDRLTREIQKNAEKMKDPPSQQSQNLPKGSESMTNLQNISSKFEKNSSVFKDIKNYLLEGMKLQAQALHSQQNMCLFSESILFKNQETCSKEGGIQEKVTEEGPLESYFDSISIKIKVKINKIKQILIVSRKSKTR